MHQGQVDFINRIKSFSPRHFDRAKVLEVGSLDINGSIRGCFTGCDYTGIDLEAGPGVDTVCEGQKYDAPDGTFDTVISCEMMEHNPYWKETFQNMVRVCKPDGLIVLTCATFGRREHGTTRRHPHASPFTVSKGWNYYQNLRIRDFEEHGLVEPLAEWRFFENWRLYDLYFVGTKCKLDHGARERLDELARYYRNESFRTFKGLKRYVKANVLLRK